MLSEKLFLFPQLRLKARVETKQNLYSNAENLKKNNVVDGFLDYVFIKKKN